MYGRSRTNRINWFQAFFFVLIGLMIGQVFSLDLSLQPREKTEQRTR